MRPFLNLFQPSARRGPRSEARYFRAAVENTFGRLSTNRGNILVYIVMVMVIFAALGAAMLSMFSTASSSSATANHNRRAFNLYESGYRYALSELTDAGFSSSSITALNTTTHKLPPEGEFVLNVFGPWFDSTALQNLSAGSDLNLKVVKGKLPPGFTTTIPSGPSYVSVVNFDYVGTTIPASASAEATFKSSADTTHLTLTVRRDFVANNNERICLAVHPDSAQPSLPNGGDLTVEGQARSIFPKRNGAIEINRKLLFYRELSDPGGSHVVLKGLSDNKNGNSFPVNVLASDYVILSPANYYIIPEGRSGGVTYGTSIDYAIGSYDTNPHPEDFKPDYKIGEDKKASDELSNNTSDPNFAVVKDDQKMVTFEKIGSASSAQFATVWFKDTRAIGGEKDFCQNGLCLFKDGIRAFFLMTFTGPGDGFTFSLLNAGNNTAASVGGDFELGELLGYAGDGRTGTNPATYITGTNHGLQPPKMAVEFDGFYNNSQAGYCLDANSLKSGSRFDPAFSGTSSGGKDNVQYVFWGSRNPVAAPCRDNSLYDDNRHNPQDSAAKLWDYPGVGTQEITQRIKTGPDGTIYALSGNNSSSSDSRLIALDPFLGSRKWEFTPPAPSPGTDDDLDAIAVDNAGNIYLGSDDNQVFARTSGGGQLWPPFPAGGQVKSPIAVSESPARIYFAANAGGTGILYALNKATGDPVVLWGAYIKHETGEIHSGVALDPVDGTIYFGTDTTPFLYALNAARPLFRWKYPSSGNIHTQPIVNSSNRDVIFASTGGQVYALPYSASSTPIRSWIFDTSSSVENALAITANGNVVYVGTTGGVLYALDAKTGSERWRYPSSGSLGAIRGKPAVDGDGTVYFGSENGHVYALNPDTGTGPLTDAQRLKWVFPSSGSIGSVKSAIEIEKDGNILFISDDGKLYSINPFTTPPNLRNLYLTDTKLQAGVSGENWFDQGLSRPWAVRVEVRRTGNAKGNFEYTLKTWMRLCPDAACTNIAGTLFGNTRLDYDPQPSPVPALPMSQTIELAGGSGNDDERFQRFLFGFTSGAGAAAQTINISQFQLSFIRPNDPVVGTSLPGPNWP